MNRPVAPSARAFTILDALAAAVVVAVLLAALVPMLGSGMHRSGMMVSANNMRTLSQAYAAYEASWNGHQFSLIREEMGSYGSCAAYASTNCTPSLILGADEVGKVWGYWLGSGVAECANGWSLCGNWSFVVPLPLGSHSGYGGGMGSCFHPNARGVREYVSDRYFDRTYYSPNDVIPYAQAGARLFDSPVEFPATEWQQSNMTLRPTYAYSGAALWHPDVFRKRSQGGFRDPGPGFPQAYRTPTAAQAAYPSLKTRMIEQRWCQEPLWLSHRYYSQTSFADVWFNVSPTSRPGTLFYDGHVAFVPMSRFKSDDDSLRTQTGTDGLWSKDTAYGTRGIFGEASIYSGFYSSPNFLTTEGILGRDLLTAE